MSETKPIETSEFGRSTDFQFSDNLYARAQTHTTLRKKKMTFTPKGYQTLISGYDILGRTRRLFANKNKVKNKRNYH